MDLNQQNSFTCVYCGTIFTHQFMLEQGRCLRHPHGTGKGKHLRYVGGDKVEYRCSFCEETAPLIMELTARWCPNYPYKLRRGRHLPVQETLQS
jgi:DNA-directed RNA polymerase subunit RPC12/RpoP